MIASLMRLPKRYFDWRDYLINSWKVSLDKKSNSLARLHGTTRTGFNLCVVASTDREFQALPVD